VLPRPRVLLALLAATTVAACAPRAEQIGTGPANTALGRPVSVSGGIGDARVVTDGQLATEGTAAPAAAVALADPRSSIVIDLGAPRPVGALFLQAGAQDVYFVEASEDASTWRVVWRVGPVHAAPLLRSRTKVLPRPVSARWLRVRPTSAHSAAVSELQAFETEPPVWPRLDTSHPDSPLPLWPGLTRERLAALFQALAALLMLVVGWSVLARRRPGGEREERVRRGALAALALASLLAWPNLLNFHYTGFVHTWETFHYYMGAKYISELGYTRLYACTAVVDAQDGVDLAGRPMRDLRDNRRVAAVSLLERADECRARFTATRWSAFEHDTRFFREAMGLERWLTVRNDHGFNGTPAWAVAAGSLARLGPASWFQVTLLALLDVGLLLLALALIGRTFGFEAAGIAAGYWGLNTLSQWGWTGGGILRYDWIFWLVAGIAALRARRPGIGGFALGYSAMLRVFPIFALVGLGLKAALEVASERSLRPLRRYTRLAAGAAVAVVLLFGASTLMAGRAQIWSEFADNSAKHLGTETVNLVGLPVVLTWDHESRIEVMTDPLLLDRHAAWKEHLTAAAHDTRLAHWAAAAAFMLLLALAVRRAPDWVAAILGIGLMPILLRLSDYYYSGLLVFAALWPVSPAAGLALTSFAWLTNVIPGLWPGLDAPYVWLSLAAVALVTGLTLAFAWRGREPPATRRG